ncbi:MAG: hypothetical protein OFPI_14090 [Osedax symbiont Rs2]|nr:MAG: hypothetical protein OFPI_14090 [Osedax symbiont Rs2]
MKLSSSALIFDLDGTISDPSLGICRSFNHALQTFGFATLADSVISNEIGPPLDVSFKKLVPALNEQLIPGLVTAYRERYADVGYSENTVYPQIPMALEKLTAAGFQLAVCTSKRVDFATKILSMFELLDHFSFVDGGDIGISKGQQLSALLTQQKIDTQAIMIGDRNIDILAAQQNSLRSIGVLWGFGAHQELAAAKADHIVHNVCELSGCFL